jgi:PKD repeat protein
LIKKLLVLLVGITLLLGVFSGCVEEETPTNTKPVAVFISDADDGVLTVTFTSSSTDADGDILIYVWDFGDQTATSTEENPSHTYTNSGDYTVTLTVNGGTEDSEPFTLDITATNPQTVALGGLPDTITNETAITFEATVIEDDAEVNETTGYAWYINNGTGEVVQDGVTIATFVHTFTEDGT